MSARDFQKRRPIGYSRGRHRATCSGLWALNFLNKIFRFPKFAATLVPIKPNTYEHNTPSVKFMSRQILLEWLNRPFKFKNLWSRPNSRVTNAFFFIVSIS